MKILVLNGPNLNLIGIREQNIYGNQSYLELMQEIELYAKKLGIEISIMQSNHEGTLIDVLHQAYHNKIDGIIINAGAYTHYSYAIRDAIKSIVIPAVEVHLSDVTAREEFRKISVLTEVCVTKIHGKGILSYLEAIDYLVKHFQET